MRSPDFRSVQSRLLQTGIAPRHARRSVDELRDHYADLVDEAMAAGALLSDAQSQALDRLGDPEDFIAGMQACRELRTWAYRYPRVAVVLYPLACLAALPAVPVIAGLARAPQLARWGMSLLLAGLFTAAMMLVLQLSIALG